jgi:hypothetical protein
MAARWIGITKRENGGRGISLSVALAFILGAAVDLGCSKAEFPSKVPDAGGSPDGLGTADGPKPPDDSGSIDQSPFEAAPTDEGTDAPATEDLADGSGDQSADEPPPIDADDANNGDGIGNDSEPPVACATVTDCPGADTVCRARSCSAGFCSFSYQPKGAKITDQSPGDCHGSICDGAGNIVVVIDDNDFGVSPQQCIRKACSAGAPVTVTQAVGTPCDDNGGTGCGANGACIIDQHFFVVRVGDGVTALSNKSTAVFLEEQRLDGTVLRTIALPTEVNGGNHRLTDSGSATSDGALALSADGHFVTLAGYDAAAGLSNVTNSDATTVNRVVGRVDAAGNVDTTTTVNNVFSGNNIRGAVTTDGTRFWVSGANIGQEGGVQTLLLGAATSTSITSNLPNTRALQIIGGNLYGSSGSAGFTTIFQVGSGLPTTSAPAVSFAGLPPTGANPYGFVLLDLDSAVAGVDTLYVGDDRPPTMDGGLQKWHFDGTTWKKVATFGSTGFRGVAGVVSGANVWLLAATADGLGSNNLMVFVDSGTGLPTIIPAAQVDGAKKVYRGLSLAPK